MSGALDSYKAKGRRPPIDEAFLDDLATCRQRLARDIKAKNPIVTEDIINESVQKILDRLIFIKNCEDRLIIPAESLWKRFKSWQETAIDVNIVTFMMDLKNLFRYFDAVYNGKLFEKHVCEDLNVGNQVLEQIINVLYGDGIYHLGYNFSVIPVDVLGQAYELYIGSIIKEKQGLASALEIVKEPQKRKEFGIYYTPEAVVSFIVRNTVGTLLKQSEDVDQVKNIKVVDPACGSGSFLIKNVDVFKEWYKDYYQKNLPKLLPGKLDSHMLHTNIEEDILTNNLFGVDLDPQAVEITILNLSLKAVSPKTKLPFMGNRVRCGNSIVSSTSPNVSDYFSDLSVIRPIDWNTEFASITVPEFDAVVGNPPYVNMEKQPEYQKYCKEFYKEVYSGKNDFHYYFITKGIQLLRDHGLLGFITSRYFIEAKYAKKLRKYILENCCIRAIIDFGNFQVFNNVSVLASIILLEKDACMEHRTSNKLKVVTVKTNKGNITDLISHIETHFDDPNFSDENINVFQLDQSYLTEDSWALDDDTTRSIKSKMKEDSFELANICEIEQSTKTGLNEAFIVSQSYAEKNHLEEEILKKVIKNSDVLKYYIDWKNKLLIYTTDATEIEEFPNIMIHLEKYKPKLESRAKEERGLYKWYRLQRPRRHELYDASEKIIVPYLCTENRFAVDSRQLYGAADTYALVPNKDCKFNCRYIAALLNSRPLEFYHKKTAKLKRGEYYEYFRKPLSKLPIKNLDLSKTENFETYNKIIALSNQIISLKKTYYDSLHLFNNMLRNVQTSKAEWVPFLKYYYRFPKQYGIDLSKTEKLVEDKECGEIRDISVEEQNDNLVISVKYISSSDSAGSLPEEQWTTLMKINFGNARTRQFIYYSMKIFLMKNYRKHTWGAGPLIETALETLKTPKFAENLAINSSTIARLMKDFETASSNESSLSTLEQETTLMEEQINKIVVNLYDLTESQNEYINAYIERQKRLVSKTI